jgi:biopolymer transport protein ExbB
MEFMKGLIDYGLIGFLILLSVIAVAIAIERHLVYRAVDVRQFRDREELEILLTARLHLIGTIASNAPYLGLLGTVLGIMLTFYTMGAEGFMDTKKTMVGLALALKATAIGLLVAIPAVTLYNLLLRRVKVLLLRWDMAAAAVDAEIEPAPTWVGRNRRPGGTDAPNPSGDSRP